MTTSWGNYPKVKHANIIELNWRDDDFAFLQTNKKFLAHGQGRSYGDCCLNENEILISTKRLNRLISFDAGKGILECEAGMTLAEILDFVVPHNWFLPVLPGTKFVSVGGAIANDVHGKNHHRAGTFGKHVISFELLRSNGEKLICTPEKNSELFYATIAGIGLTGIILSAKLKLKSIQSSMLAVEYIKFQNLNEFFALAQSSEEKYEYTVAWLDCVADGKDFGRGIFMRGNHEERRVGKGALATCSPPAKKSIPFYFPQFALNRYSVKAFNHLYFHRQAMKKNIQSVTIDSFFFPLDAIKNWNKIYGKRGFVQYQCVIPESNAKQISKVLKTIVQAGQSSFLSVLKTFGDVKSPGMLSFPKKGVTLALDLPFRGEKTLKLLKDLDSMVIDAGGRIYPAKDACMNSNAFKIFYPQWQDFSKYIDPKFSSSLWRRVTQNES